MPDVDFTAALSPGQRKYVERLVARCQPLMSDDEQVLTAFTVVKGIGSDKLVLISWFTQPLLFLQQFRVVAVTERNVHVFKSGFVTRFKPKQLLRTLPRSTAIRPSQGVRFELGPERV